MGLFICFIPCPKDASLFPMSKAEIQERRTQNSLKNSGPAPRLIPVEIAFHDPLADITVSLINL